ncbi:MAG: hypothetical protein OET79_06640, partial [Nitrospirota bacterium]|nr:hypothetical protein [Nitrospirota bacterium]
IVDPPPMSANDIRFARQEGPVDYIIVTNRDHTREAGELKNEFHCTVMAPELDAKEMSITIDKTFKDGELLPGGIWVVQLAHQKSPGESALFLETGKGILIVGDAVIGYPAGDLRLLPHEKYADMGQAREGLRRLLKYNFDSLIVGDGASIVTAAKPILERTLAEA